jgi:aminoglycoside phosphotransferase (APT) family kinase protein
VFIEPSREAPQDWEAVARYLGGLGMRLDREFPIRQFASGVANLNYLISLDRKVAVFRRPPNNDAPPGAYDFARQYKILSRLSARLATTPSALAYCDDVGVIGVPFLITEFRKGVTIGRDLPESLVSVENIGGKLSAMIIGAMAQLHAISPGEVGLGDLGRAQGFIARQINGWRNRASRVMSDEQMRKIETLHDALVTLQPAERSGTLVHLDFKLENVLVDPLTLTVQGIIDWEMATIGDPYYDLMLMLLVWGEPNDVPVYAGQSGMPRHAPGWWTRRQALNAYQEATKTVLPETDAKFYWLLAMYRNIGAVAQLIALYAREPMSNTNNLDMPSSVASMLDHAIALIDRPLDW